MRTRALFGLLLVASCGTTGGDGGGAGAPSSSGGDPTASADGGDGDGGVTTGDAGDPTPRYGRFGTPEITFTLPVPAGEAPAMYFPNITQKFPDVDWAKLDRLYIPAGTYRTLLISGLPERGPERPLVMTNLGGQVKIGGFASNYVVSIGGGKNWILTGRFDPVSKTGDAGFRGHAEGAYAHSQGTYGIFVDDAFSKEGLSGIAIGSKASDFELDVVEVARADFAGVIAKTDNDGSAVMRNVRFHDMYIHDTGSEGIYFGSTQAQPQHAFEDLRIHDNRILRTGTEALQVGQQGGGVEVHHNVLGPGAIRWRSAFADYQDGNVQYGQRYGSGSFHHNVVVGTGDLFVELFPSNIPGDPHAPGTDTISFADNYFADTASGGIYTHADDTGVTIRFERNYLRGFRFAYDAVHPGATAPAQVFGAGAGTADPHVVADNHVEAPFPFIAYPNAKVTATNNVEGPVARIQFRDFMTAAIDEDYRRVEWWTDHATRAPGSPLVTYPAGAFVMHRGTLYEALASNSAQAPDAHPETWKAHAAPADDVRVVGPSPYAGFGVR